MADEEDPAAGTGPATLRSLEEENAQLKAKIAFLEEKIQLVGSVTRHDVLNQLTAVVGYNELMGMMIEDPKFRSFLDKERQAIAKIRRQFQFAKDYQNIAVAPPLWQNIRNLVYRVSENIEMNDVRLTVETGTASVLADPLLEKVFLHIFENALRYGGDITRIRVILEQTGDAAILSIENDGAGIPSEDKQKIFERGYGKGGTGWGLFLARKILGVSGMAISETGNPEKGVRFEIAIPAGSFRMHDGENAPQ